MIPITQPNGTLIVSGTIVLSSPPVVSPQLLRSTMIYIPVFSRQI